MTDRDRKIAEMFEPEPTEAGGYYDSLSCLYRKRNGTSNGGLKQTSPLGFWKWRDNWQEVVCPVNDMFGCIHEECYDGKDGKWYHRDVKKNLGAWDAVPSTDPDLTLHLLKWLLERHNEKEIWDQLRVAVIWQKQSLESAIAEAVLREGGKG